MTLPRSSAKDPDPRTRRASRRLAALVLLSIAWSGAGGIANAADLDTLRLDRINRALGRSSVIRVSGTFGVANLRLVHADRLGLAAERWGPG